MAGTQVTRRLIDNHGHHNLKQIIYFFFGFSLYFFNGSLVIAQESLQPLELLTNPTPIFSEQQKNGRMSGYGVEYAKSVFQLAGYKPTVTPLPFARLIKQMNQSEPVVALGIGRTPEREDDFFWIAPITANVIGVFSIVDDSLNSNFLTSNAENTISQSADYQKKTKRAGFDKLKSVGVLRGDYRADILRSHGVKDVVEYNTWQQAIGAVLKGRVSSVFFSELGVSITCKLAGLDCAALKKTFTYDIQFSYIAMLKTDQNREHAIKLANAAERFIKTSSFNQLVERWLPQLQVMEANVGVTEGVITLGKIDSSQSFVNQIWVLTHLEPPFSQYDERGKPSGYAVELVKGILNEAGMRQQILAAPWQRILVESKMKPDVLVFALARTQTREENFYWISPITQNAYSVFGHQSAQKNTSIDAIEQLPPQSLIAVLAGDFREQVIIDAGHIAVATPTWQVALQKFLTGEANYLFFSDGGIDIICPIIEEPCTDITKVFQFQLATTYLAVSKQGTSQQLVEKLTSAAVKFKQTTQYKMMVEGWLMEFKQRNMANMHEQDGIIKLWAQTTYKQ
jgi:ABC-type amino acid transport substrate-binding protein